MRGLLDVLEDIANVTQIKADAEVALIRLRTEVEDLADMPYDRFEGGARLLVWPKDRPGYERALQEYREMFGGAL